MLAFVVVCRSRETGLSANLLREYLAPQMSLEPLTPELLVDPAVLNAALEAEPGRARVWIIGPRADVDERRAKNNDYAGQWVCLKPGETHPELQPCTGYKVRKSAGICTPYFSLSDSGGSEIPASITYPYLSEWLNCLPLHAALIQSLPAETVACLVAAAPETLSVTTPDGLLPLHLALNASYPAETVASLFGAYPEAASVTDPQGLLPLHLALNKSHPAEVVASLFDAYPEAADSASLLGPTRLPAKTTEVLASLSLQSVKSEVQGVKSEVQGLRDEMQAIKQDVSMLKDTVTASMEQFGQMLQTLISDNGRL